MPFGLLELSFLSCPLPQIEEIVTLIQDETEGVPIRTVKSFRTKIPSVVTGKTPPPPLPFSLLLYPAAGPDRPPNTLHKQEVSHLNWLKKLMHSNKKMFQMLFG